MLLAKRNSDLFPNLFDEFFGNTWSGNNSDSYVNYRKPAVNIKESENAYDLELAAPGMNKEDFKVHLEKNVLTISSEKKQDSKENTEDYTKREFYYGNFSRSFGLPEKYVDDANISASYENGVLHVNIPKLEEAKTKLSREIAIA